MVRRWVAAGMVNADGRFRRIKGCKDMPVLMAALAGHAEEVGVRLGAWDPSGRQRTSTRFGTSPSDLVRLLRQLDDQEQLTKPHDHTHELPYLNYLVMGGAVTPGEVVGGLFDCWLLVVVTGVCFCLCSEGAPQKKTMIVRIKPAMVAAATMMRTIGFHRGLRSLLTDILAPNSV